VSLVVHALPSLHEVVLFVCTQPVEVLHESFVHGFPSLQFGAAPPTHFPPEQVSFVVHAFPSLHAIVLFEWTQPVAALHESFVHGFPSSQFGAAPPTHFPPEHVSLVVHAFPSSQGIALLACLHPTAVSQKSVVQTLPSSQLGAAPPTHVPPEHLSLVVHSFPSSHPVVLLVFTQPATGSHESSVQAFPSSQLPLESSCLQPVTPSHQSVVQTFLSLHSFAPLLLTIPSQSSSLSLQISVAPG
jgi:hypothetical protein